MKNINSLNDMSILDKHIEEETDLYYTGFPKYEDIKKYKDSEFAHYYECYYEWGDRKATRSNNKVKYFKNPIFGYEIARIRIDCLKTIELADWKLSDKEHALGDILINIKKIGRTYDIEISHMITPFYELNEMQSIAYKILNCFKNPEILSFVINNECKYGLYYNIEDIFRWDKNKLTEEQIMKECIINKLKR